MGKISAIASTLERKVYIRKVRPFFYSSSNLNNTQRPNLSKGQCLRKLTSVRKSSLHFIEVIVICSSMLYKLEVFNRISNVYFAICEYTLAGITCELLFKHREESFQRIRFPEYKQFTSDLLTQFLAYCFILQEQ